MEVDDRFTVSMFVAEGNILGCSMEVHRRLCKHYPMCMVLDHDRMIVRA